jgi:hypothetical protein
MQINKRQYLAASTKAVLMTLSGSMIPAFTMSTYSPGQGISSHIQHQKHELNKVKQNNNG